MENQFDKMPEENLTNNKDINKTNKKKITQPIIALLLDILPLATVFLIDSPSAFVSYLVLIMFFSPIGGLILAIVSLRQGKEVIGLAGKIISIIAIILPFIPIVFIMILYIGMDFGIISNM